jgi:hypothetical protein
MALSKGEVSWEKEVKTWNKKRALNKRDFIVDYSVKTNIGNAFGG